MQPVLPDDQAGGRPGSRVTSRSNAKRSNQEKATPMMAVRASHGLHTPLAPKSGSVGNSLRSDSRRFFIRFRHQRRVAIDGDHVKNNGNGNGRYAERQGQRQLSPRDTPVCTDTELHRNRLRGRVT